MISPPPSSGQIVRVRQRQYLAEEVVPPPSPGDATLVRLSCLDDDAQGEPLEVLWEMEVDPEILTGEAWDHLETRGFDPPRLFAAYFHALRWNCVTATDPRLFQAPFRAGIKIDPYQLEPLRKALLLPRVNLFIADDVGLGKTIEAGLIARELLLRRRVRDIVVACPPSMLFQWQDELEIRFGLTFQILDKAYVARVRQERGYGVNPWTTHTPFLVSQRLLIDEAYTAPLLDWLGDFRPGALLILDEAHHAAPASGARYAIDSQFTRAIRDLAWRFEHRLFLSATPHNGHSNSFSALLELLDPQRFCRGVPVRSRKLLDDVMVRRLKEDIREVAGGFPKRTVRQIDIDGLPSKAPELRLSRLLDEYRRLRETRLAGETRRTQAAAALLVSGLQQRLLSSIEAFARTLDVHRRTVERERARTQAATSAKAAPLGRLDLLAEPIGNDDDRATLPVEELDAEVDAQIEAATAATTGTGAGRATREAAVREGQLLEEMARLAGEGRGVPDARVWKLVDWIREHLCPGLPSLGAPVAAGRPPAWTDTRVIIFTEYDDTKRYLREQLAAAIAGTDRAAERILVYHGPTPPAEREAIKRAFNTDPRKHPVRILLATDAAREGLNLQGFCWNLFHFDVPWNPSRMEQRNGRIDRKLQPQPEVVCHYFVYRQRVEDRILRALVRKTETIKRELGSLAQVIEGRLGEALSYGIRHVDVERLEREIETADLATDAKRTVAEELDEARERQDKLLAQVDRLRTRLQASKDWIGLDEDQFRGSISSALELMAAPPLKAVPRSDGDEIERWEFPALDRRDGADPTWAETLDTLRAPREREQRFWEWRRESPLRPVVFEDTGTMDGEAVHLHLEHRVVRRLLGRFTAQGFVRHDLARACLAQSTDAIPRVILLGRLSLYGPGAVRLHEAIVPVTARWVETTRRTAALAPYGREAETKTLELLEASLLAKPAKPVGEPIVRRLRDVATRDVRELLPHLETRGRELAGEAARQLAERGDHEAQSMQGILVTQKRRVAETAERFRNPQMTLDFDDAALRQLDANRRHWDRRLAAIDRELATEPVRIRDLYQVKAQRIEPVGLVYLWPLSG
jgi:SNF2 family DNA or RNA helicase